MKPAVLSEIPDRLARDGHLMQLFVTSVVFYSQKEDTL